MYYLRVGCDCRFGRKKTLMASLIMQLALGILVAICPWFELYLVLRFILGFVCVSIVFSGFVLCKYFIRKQVTLHTDIFVNEKNRARVKCQVS